MEKNKKNFQFISLAEVGKTFGYTQEYLNMLSRRKRLHSEKIGRNWYTTKEWLREYFLSENGIKKRKNSKVEEFLKSMEASVKIDGVENEENADFNFYREDQKIKELQEIKEKLATDNFLGEEIKKTRRLMIFKFSIAIVCVFIFYFGISFVRYHYLKNKDQNFSKTEWQEITETFGDRKVKDDETGSRYQFSNTAMASENFVVKEISFGGEMSIAAGGNEKISLEIFDVKSESFLSKDKNSSHFIVTWKTNKLAINEIEYSKNNGDDLKRLKQSDYGFSHGVMISKLDPGMPYIYKIKATDRWGNLITSDTFAFYSGSKESSIFEIIFQELEKMFGWTIK